MNKAVTGMDTRNYRGVQFNLNKNEAAREAFTNSMLGFLGTVNCLVRDNLIGGGDANGQLTFMHRKCATAASILGLHEIAKVVQPRSHIASNKQVMRDAGQLQNICVYNRVKMVSPAHPGLSHARSGLFFMIFF